MSEISKFYFEDFILSLNRSSYLVEVLAPVSDPPRKDRVEDLPDWVFHSKFTIWLRQDDSSIYERSLAGERIRKSLISAKQQHKAASFGF